MASKRPSRFFFPQSSNQSQSSLEAQPAPSITLTSTSTLPQTQTQASKPSSATEQASEFLKTTSHVRTQLDEVQRLRDLKAHRLGAAELKWIDSTIADIADAAHDLALLLEPTRLEQTIHRGKLSLATQLRWKYRDGQRAVQKSQRLLAYHGSLIGVLGHLQRVDDAPREEETETDTETISSPASLPTRQQTIRFELDAEVTARVASAGAREFEIFPADYAQGKGAWAGGEGLKGAREKPGEEKIVAYKDENVDSGVAKQAEENAVECEMDDLLAWRRSRRPTSEVNPSVVCISPDGNVGV
ncbi:hypothetical protein P170DRAFT_507978 [Aspergillus steynii IBT 23096]|uniref:Uncharacterized protein n=1 Tax=Aspergillus steynii IBT 23096 TaxID=1392250 RepID=A0A2I2GKA5_9EURO|nr:uncharacterized protein P170DRAFT_507978 [Aspergillus steynii IBT 23096]PLB53310.1 hypothetical protein P170DRAFT_507978 [Aspergillus steynii IBT 23096]